MRKYFISSLLAAVLVVIAFINTPSAHAAVLTNTNTPINIDVFSPCANNGQGEFVALSGNIHTLATTTFDNGGGGHGTLQFNFQGVSGIGQTTGAKYQAPGAVETAAVNANLGGQQGDDTATFTLRYIGQGPGNNLLFHLVFHFTFNADGTLTVYFTNFSGANGCSNG